MSCATLPPPPAPALIAKAVVRPKPVLQRAPAVQHWPPEPGEPSPGAAGPLTVFVNETITLYGIDYAAVGTLTLTPIPGPAPRVDVYSTAPGVFITTARVGATFIINGANFGDAPGTVLWGSTAFPVTSWTDTMITVSVPASTPPGKFGPIVSRADSATGIGAPLTVTP